MFIYRIRDDLTINKTKTSNKLVKPMVIAVKHNEQMNILIYSNDDLDSFDLCHLILHIIFTKTQNTLKEELKKYFVGYDVQVSY